MIYALSLGIDGRILSATYPQYAPADAAIVETLPVGNINDYIYSDGGFVYDPLPEPEPEPEPEKPTIAELQKRIADLETALELLVSVATEVTE